MNPSNNDYWVAIITVLSRMIMKNVYGLLLVVYTLLLLYY